MELYEWVRGPMAWVALTVFAAGCLYRILCLFILAKGEKPGDPLRRSRDGLRSVLHGLVPFGSTYMRKKPVFTLTALVFHLGLILVPIFLLAHIILWYESWKIQWWSLPDPMADGMTLLVILCCLFFLVRRISVPAVRSVTKPFDWVLLAMILLPFLTGFLATHQWGPYKPVLILHMVSGEILLAAIPFSRLRHMLFFFFSRAYMGSEFGSALTLRDW